MVITIGRAVAPRTRMTIHPFLFNVMMPLPPGSSYQIFARIARISMSKAGHYMKSETVIIWEERTVNAN
jgi:hypothetical protein